MAQDTYIHKHPTKEKNSYYILNFNFAGLSNKKGVELEREFAKKVSEGISECIQRYKLPVSVLTGMSPARILSDFLSNMMHQLNGIQYYAIIDEYDHFANDLLSFRFQEFTNIMGSEGYVRAFYTLCAHGVKNYTEGTQSEEWYTKRNWQNLCDRSFTNQFRFYDKWVGAAHPGCNISTNLSLDPEYHEMMGLALPAFGVQMTK